MSTRSDQFGPVTLAEGKKWYKYGSLHCSQADRVLRITEVVEHEQRVGYAAYHVRKHDRYEVSNG